MFTYTLAQYVAHKTNVAQQFTAQMHYRLPHPGQSILGPSPAIYTSQPTTLLSALITMPLQDLTWNMDTARAIFVQLPSRQLLPLLFSRQVLPRGINA
ncbi:hypothetical protein Tco_1053618 [Tanacetum coccineum]|uniref:Uncharacterized protein n=1 Tax=Tanacetum coccineum TaxID=301880 RepID=A0ABQ5GUE5_9ASTR